MISRTQKTYGNINDSLVKWFQQEVCSLCKEAPNKHGNSKIKKQKRLSKPVQKHAVTTEESVPNSKSSSPTNNETECHPSPPPPPLPSHLKSSTTSSTPVSKTTIILPIVFQFFNAEEKNKQAVIKFTKSKNHFLTHMEEEDIDKVSMQLARFRVKSGRRAQFDNSCLDEYQGCWMNSCIQILLRVFSKKEWKALLQVVIEIGKKRRHDCKDSKTSKTSISYNDIRNTADEELRQKRMDEMKQELVRIREDIMISFMDIIFNINTPSANMVIDSNVLVSHVSTRILAEKLACDYTLASGLADDMTSQMDALEIFLHMMTMFKEFDKNIVESLSPAINLRRTCQACGQQSEVDNTDDQTCALFCHSQQIRERWEEKLNLDGIEKSDPMCWLQFLQKHDTTFATASIQEILSSLEKGKRDDCRNHNHIDEITNKKKKLSSRNKEYGFACSGKDCADSRYYQQHVIKNLNTFSVVSLQQIPQPHINLSPGTLDRGDDDELEVIPDYLLTKMLLPKVWIEDWNAIGEFKCGDETTELKLCGAVLRESTFSGLSHFIAAIKYSSNDTSNDWVTLDDNVISKGLPDRTQYHPVYLLFTTVKRSRK